MPDIIDQELDRDIAELKARLRTDARFAWVQLGLVIALNIAATLNLLAFLVSD